MEGADAETLSEGENVTLLNWGNITVTKVTRYCQTSPWQHKYRSPSPLIRSEGKVVSLEGRLELENTDFKNTQKLTWLADCGSAQTTPTICFHFDHLITKGVLKPEDDFKDYVNYHSKVTMAKISFLLFSQNLSKFWRLVKFSLHGLWWVWSWWWVWSGGV